MIRSLTAAAFAAGMLFTSSAAQAASYPGDYNAMAYANNDSAHAVWLNDMGDVFTDTDWKFVNNSGAFSFDGTTATLTGRLANDDGPAYFDATFNFSYLQTGGRPPKCELGGYCSNAQYLADSGMFDYMQLTSGTLVGGDSLADIVLGLTERPVSGQYPGQLGISANNKSEGIGILGFSVWFFWEVLQNDNIAYSGLTEGRTGRGDVNIKLTPVPLPAGAVLLLTGVAALGVGRRRRKA